MNIVTSRTRALSERPPRFPWAVNRDHWSADGLHSIFPLFGPEGMRDLVNGWRLSRSSATLVTFNVQSGPDAPVVDLAGSSNNEAYIDGAAFPSEPFTFLCWANLDSTASGGMLMCTATAAASNQQHRMGVETLDTISARSFAGGFSTGGATIAAGTTYLFGGVFSATNARQSFTDGTPDTLETTSSGGPWTLDALSIGSTSDSTPFGELNGRVWDARIYSRTLSANDMVMLRYDPSQRWGAYYEMGRRTYFIPAAAASGSIFRGMTLLGVGM